MLTWKQKAKRKKYYYFWLGQKMPVINVEDLTDKDKALMEVNQLKTEVKLERWLVSSAHWGEEPFFVLYFEKYRHPSKRKTSEESPELSTASCCFRRLNAARRSRNTFRPEWRRTHSSKAFQRRRTPSRRKEAVSSAKNWIWGVFSCPRLAHKDVLPSPRKMNLQIKQD